MSRSHVYSVEVQWGDCDAAGIVYFPNFCRWMDAAAHQFFLACGLPQWRELERTRGILGIPMIELATRFHNPAAYGDRLDIHTHVAEWRRKVFVLQHRVQRGDTLICEGREVRAFCAHAGQSPPKMRAVEVPADIRALCE